MRPFSLFKAVLITCLISLTFILCENHAFAQVNIGKLSAFKGEVVLEREGRPIALKLNMPIVAKDRIRVEEGMAEVQYDDGSTLTIKLHTDITLDLVKKKRRIFGIFSKTYLSRLINIFKGKVSGIIKERKDLVTEFETPTLVAAVRGTTITITTDPITGETIATTDSGEAFVFSPNGWAGATLSTGESIGMYYDPTTGAISIHSYSGTISVRTGDTTSTVTPDSTMTANIDPTTGAASVRADKGTITVAVGDSTATLEEGESIYGDVDAEGNATIVATEGSTVEVTAGGETITLTPEANSTTIPKEGTPGPPETYVPPAPPPLIPPTIPEEPPITDLPPASPV